MLREIVFEPFASHFHLTGLNRFIFTNKANELKNHSVDEKKSTLRKKVVKCSFIIELSDKSLETAVSFSREIRLKVLSHTLNKSLGRI